MGLSFIGHSPSFNIWVFSVDGRELVARNFSTQSPLQLSFKGVWEKYSGGAPLINVLCTMYLHPPETKVNPLLWLGYVITAGGAAMVFYFKPKG